MKRLQRKCLVASAVTHGLLLVMLLVASAFVPQKKAPESFEFTLMTIPDLLVDTPNVVSGGNPLAGLANVEPQQSTARPPEPAPAQPQPQPQQPKPVEPQPEPVRPEPIRNEPKPEVKPIEPPPSKFNLSEAVNKKAAPRPEPPSKAKPESTFDLSKAARKTITPSPNSKTANPSDNAAAQREKQLASAANDAMSRVTRGLSSGIGEIGIPGPGGPAYASYNLALIKYYEERWITPQAYTDNEPIVAVEVTIRGDGSVLNWRFLKKGGKRDLDKSVETTMDRVKKVPPFPSGNKDETRVFKINFNLSSKLNLG